LCQDTASVADLDDVGKVDPSDVAILEAADALVREEEERTRVEANAAIEVGNGSLALRENAARLQLRGHCIGDLTAHHHARIRPRRISTAHEPDNATGPRAEEGENDPEHPSRGRTTNGGPHHRSRVLHACVRARILSHSRSSTSARILSHSRSNASARFRLER